VSRETSDRSVGGEEPRKPLHSLPRYSEPTPETHRKLSRETEAELALKHTVFTHGSRWLLIALFLITITAVPTLQLVAELRAPRPSGGLATFDIYKVLPSWAKIRTVRKPSHLWRLLPLAADLKAAEKAIERESVVSAWLLPRVQVLLSGKLGAGNEQVYLGRDGWLFYRPDVEYVTGPPVLDPLQMRHRNGVQPDPIKAIVGFRNQLAARGIELIIVPLPVKPGIEANKLSADAAGRSPLHNASFAEFKARLEKAGVRIFDPVPSLLEGNADAPRYLQTDTHWRPETMERVAENLAALIQPSTSTGHATLQVTQKEITAPLGDLARMLKLPPAQNLWPPEKVTIHEVLSGNELWHPSKEADILLLGDSFSNIFSLESAGWGVSAGFAEHLSRALGGRPLDCILRNGEGANATRQILSSDLARGHDRLAGKKLVIWEFVEREITRNETGRATAGSILRAESERRSCGQWNG